MAKITVTLMVVAASVFGAGPSFAQTTNIPLDRSPDTEPQYVPKAAPLPTTPGDGSTQGAALFILNAVNGNLQKISAQLSEHVGGGQDPFRFCYFNGQAYSIGSVRDGFECSEAGVHVSTEDGAIDRERSDPLRWVPQQKRQAR